MSFFYNTHARVWLLVSMLYACDDGGSGTPAMDTAAAADVNNNGADSDEPTRVDTSSSSDCGFFLCEDITYTPDGCGFFGNAPCDDTSVIDFPEPGSAEYWAQIIPGIWEEKPCVEFNPDDCTVELTVTAPYGEWVEACADASVLIEGNLGALYGLCLHESGSTLSLCKEQTNCSLQAKGTLTEKVIAKGVCATKTDSGDTRTCVRPADCADLALPTCNNAHVEYWMEFCFWHPGDGGCAGGNRSFVKID